MSPTTCLTILNKKLASLNRIDYLLLNEIFEGLDVMHPYQKIVNGYYYPLLQSPDNCTFPRILGFGIGFQGYEEMILRNPEIQYHQICKELMDLEMKLDAPLYFIDTAAGSKDSLNQVFSITQETIIEYDENDYLEASHKNSKSFSVFDFCFQASLKILQYQLTKKYAEGGTIHWQTFFKNFEKLNHSNKNGSLSLKIQPWIKRLQICLLIFENIGSFAAALYASSIFFELEKEFMLRALSQSEEDDLTLALQIRQSQVIPSDISPKTIALLEYLDSFVHKNSQEWSLTLIFVENRDVAMFLFKLLTEMSSIFQNMSTAFSGYDLDEMKNLKERKINSLILTDLEEEKDFSVLLGYSVEGVIFFDASPFSFEFFSELERIPQLPKKFENTKRIVMVKRNDLDALHQISQYRLKSECSRFLKGKEFLAEKNGIDFISLLMGEVGSHKLEPLSTKASISEERCLQTLSWFCSLNRLAPPYFIQFWPPESILDMNPNQFEQEWNNLIELLVNQRKTRKVGNQAEIMLLQSLKSKQVRSMEFYMFACCWIMKDKEYMVYGFPRSTEKLAQNSASLLACEHLYFNEKLLDENLLPTQIFPTKKNSASSHSNQIRPSAFEPLERSKTGPYELNVTVFVFRPSEEDDASAYPPPFFNNQYAAIATKKPIPIDSIPCFDIFLRKADKYTVEPHPFHQLGESIVVSSKEMELIEGFQHKIWSEYVGLKKKEDSDETRWFLILPVLYRPPNHASSFQSWFIDWEFLKLCLDHRAPCTAYQFLSHIASTESPIQSLAIEMNKSKSTKADLEEILQRFNDYDRQEFIDYLNQALSDIVVGVLHDPSARYINLRIDPNFHGNDVVIMDEDCISFAAHFHSKGVHVAHSEVFGLQGQKLHRYSNVLTKIDLDTIQEDYTSLLLDVAHVLPISEWFIQQIWAIPSIIHYLEPFCIADDFLNQFGNAIDLIPISQLYPAFIHSSTNRIENYERLEFVGDAALKLVIAIYLYQNQDFSEGEFSRLKGVIVSNKTLNEIGRLNRIDDMIQVGDFNPWFFKPPFYECRSGKAPPARIVSAKMCADVVEAIAGSFFLAGGLLSVWKFFEAIGMVPGIEHVWLEIEKQVFLAPIPDKVNFEKMKQLEECLGYEFTTPALLSLAMTHSSISFSFNYERLEFVGDAILDLLLAKYTYDIYPEATPQDLSNMRVNAVNNEAFSRMTFALGLHEFLQQTGYEDVINEYIMYLETLEPYSDPYKTEIEGPKILGDIFESLIGAIFIDCQGNLDKVWALLFPKWKPYLDKYIRPDLVFVSDLRHLYMFPGVDGRDVNFKFISDSCNHDQTVTCELYIGDKLLATARGQSKKLAKEAAAKLALEILSKERNV